MNRLPFLATYVFTCASRLSPLYFLLLAIWTTLYKYFGSGPFWPEVSDVNCYSSWWTNLLYVNNIVNQDSMVILVWFWRIASLGSFKELRIDL